MHTNDNRIAMACTDRMVRIHKRKDFELISEFKGNNELIRRVKFSPDGIYIIVIGDDPFVRMYNHHTHNLERQFKSYLDQTLDMDITRNGDMVCIVGEGNRIKFINIAS